MKILFALNTVGFIRHFDRTVVELSERGHRVTLAVTDRVGGAPAGVPDELLGVPGIRVVEAPFQRGNRHHDSVRVLRSFRDYARYHGPRFAGKDAYRARALEEFLRLVSVASRPVGEGPAGAFFNLSRAENECAINTLQALENLVPSDPICERFLQSENADVLLVTPLVDFSSRQVDLVKSARHLGLPVGFPVFSWDNLSTKGVVHVAPDRLFVWNEIQQREALDLHGLDANRVIVTGAPRFDAFLETRPSEEREALCRRLGFNAERPIVTYLGSAPFISPLEPSFVDQWIGRLRSAPSAEVRAANILIRPHPRSSGAWNDWRSDRWPGVGMFKTSFLGDQALYDSIYHADVVVALNTSAQIEAGLLGKPVLTVLTPEYAPGQQGSVHFNYLLKEQGGHVEVATDTDQHLAQLEAVLRGEFDSERCQRAIERFVRPAGIDRPASPILADAVESWMIAEARPRPSRLSRARQRLVNAVSRTNAIDDEAVAAVVRTRVRYQRQRDKQWKRQVESLKAELTQLRSSAPGKSTPPKTTPERVPVDEERRVVEVDYSGAAIRIFATSRAERSWRARACAKEPWTVDWLDDYVRPGDVVFDLGANVGVFSFIAATRLSGEGTVIAFEPSYANYARLCENIVLNQLDATVIPVPLPVSNTNGLQAFSYRSAAPGQSRHGFRGELWNGNERGSKYYTQPMLAMTLDDLVERFGLPAPTHVKIDVDGAERHVLAGATRTLSDASVRSLMIEIDVECGDEVCQRLNSFGLSLCSRYQSTSSRRDAPWYGLFERASGEEGLA